VIAAATSPAILASRRWEVPTTALLTELSRARSHAPITVRIDDCVALLVICVNQLV